MSPLSQAISRMLWAVTALLATFAALSFVWGMAEATGAPQQAAAAAAACAMAVLPYVFARAWDEMFRPAATTTPLQKGTLKALGVVGIAVGIGVVALWGVASLVSWMSTPTPQLDYTWEDRAGRMSVMNTSLHTLTGAVLVINDRWECPVGNLKMAETRRVALDACRTADGRAFDPGTDQVERTTLRARVDGGGEQSVSKPRRGTQVP